MKSISIRNIFILFISIFCLHVYIIDIDYVSSSNYFLELYKSLINIDIKLLVLLSLFYYFFNIVLLKRRVVNRFYLFYSLMLSVLSVIGKCYVSNSSSILILFKSVVQVYKFIVLIISYSIIYYSIMLRFEDFKCTSIVVKRSFLSKIWDKHSNVITFILLVICYLPYLIIFYPGGATGDTADSIYQFFHSSNSWTVKSINLLDNSIYINKHHSVLFTVMLGNFIKVGRFFLSNNFGLFLFNLFQLIIVILILTYLFNFLKKNNLPYIVIILLLLYFCFNPVIINYSITAVKDTFFAVSTLIYVIFLYKIVTNSDFIRNKVNILLLIVIMLLVLLLRNNGIYTIILSYPFLFLISIKNKKKIKYILLLVLTIYISFNNVLFSYFKISNGSPREMLSIPFMQIARCVKYHEDDFSKEDKEIINKVLNYRIVSSSYNPLISDDIKNTYRKNSTKEDRYNFFRLWFKFFKKYPLVYIDSFLNSTYGYYYPNTLDSSPMILIFNSLNIQRDIVFGYVTRFNVLKGILNYWLRCLYNNPFLVYFYNVGMINLFLLFGFIYILRKRHYRYVIPLLPLLSIFLVCLASPVNGSNRYILPIYFSFPMIILILYNVYKDG